MKKASLVAGALVHLAIACPAFAGDEPDANGVAVPAMGVADPATAGAPEAVDTAEPVSVTEVAKPAAPGVTLKKGAINVQLAFEANLSKDAVIKPFSIAPDVAYGVTPELTVSVVHSGYAMTGFRGSAGAGLCVAGEENGCLKVYNAVGLEGLYGLLAGPLSLGANVGLHARSLSDPFIGAVKLGLKGKYTAGATSVVFLPSINVAVTERETAPDRLWLPVGLLYKVAPPVTLGLGAGVKVLDLGAAGDTWQLAVGLNGQYALNPEVVLGAAFTFGAITGGGDPPELDGRFLQCWVGYTM